MDNRLYWATISWDGVLDKDGRFIPESEGNFTFTRDRLSYLIEGVEEYLEKWKARDAYLDTASEEKGADYKDLTSLIKSELQKRK